MPGQPGALHFAGAPVVQREFEDEEKIAEDAVGVMRGPAPQPVESTPTAERRNEFGEMDGEISSSVQPHAFTDKGRTGESTWHHTGGGGGKGNFNTGHATLLAPVYKSKAPAKPGGRAKAWVESGTGTVKVKRSYVGVTHGKQGAYTADPPGTVWMSPRARTRVDVHEQNHTDKTEKFHDKYIKPLEWRIWKFSGFLHANKHGADEPAAIAALQAKIDWDNSVQQFADADTAENRPMGPLDLKDMNKSDFYKDYETSDKFRAKENCTIYEGVGASRRKKSKK